MMKTDEAQAKARELLSKKPHTASELAGALGVSKPTAYALIKFLGAAVVGKVRRGAKGPLAAQFIMPKSA
jgi:hypothetical protein